MVLWSVIIYQSVLTALVGNPGSFSLSFYVIDLFLLLNPIHHLHSVVYTPLSKFLVPLLHFISLRLHFLLIPVPSPCFCISPLLLPFIVCYPMLSSHPLLSRHLPFSLFAISFSLILPFLCLLLPLSLSHSPGLSSTFPVILMPPQNTTSLFPWVVNNRSY